MSIVTGTNANCQNIYKQQKIILDKQIPKLNKTQISAENENYGSYINSILKTTQQFIQVNSNFLSFFPCSSFSVLGSTL